MKGFKKFLKTKYMYKNYKKYKKNNCYNYSFCYIWPYAKSGLHLSGKDHDIGKGE